MKRILSAIKPTGQLTLGNYIGALRHFKDHQDEGEVYIFVADLHALTLPIEPEILRQNTIDIACYYLASGLDPKKTTIFLQSSVSAHAELNAIIQNYLYMGELRRMTQFKDKCSKMKDSEVGLGIFAYPVLMAADIILYDADVVPVGEDQSQHVELCRDLVHRFNARYGKEIFKMPKAEVPTTGARIMSLSDPSKKMSKSDPKGDIFLNDDIKVIRKKIMSAKTDMLARVHYDLIEQPGVSNLLTIYASLSDITPQEAEKRFEGLTMYGEFKKAVADKVEEELLPFKNRFQEIKDNKIYLDVLRDGAKKARLTANKTLKRAQKAVGLLSLDE